MEYKQIMKFDKAYIHLDITGIKMPHDHAAYQDFTDFPVSSYPKLKLNPNNSEVWDGRMAILNTFFKTMDAHTQSTVATALITLRAKINAEAKAVIADTSKIVPLNVELSGIILDMENKCHLKEQLIDFVESDIAIKHNSSNGRRAQDSTPMTFLRHEVVELLALTLYCKMLVVIFGSYMDLLKPITARVAKERHCITMMQGLISHHFQDIVTRLQGYQTTHVKKAFAENPASVMCGSTTVNLASSIMDTTLSRHLVNAELSHEKSGVLNYVMQSAKKAMGNPTQAKGAPYRMCEKQFSADTGEEGNSSVLEADTLRSSKHPLSTGLLVRSYVRKFTTQRLADLHLSVTSYNKLLDYYTTHPYQVTDLTVSLIARLYGHSLGGGTSIKHLSIKELTPLIALTQLHALEQGYHELVYFLSCTQMQLITTDVVVDRNVSITRSYMSSDAYIGCRKYYVVCVSDGGAVFDAKMNELVDDALTKQYTYNLPGWFQSGPNLNGERLVITDKLLQEVFGMMNDSIHKD